MLRQHDSPRSRRLRADLAALRALAADSTVFRFAGVGEAPDAYRVVFTGPGTVRVSGTGAVTLAGRHEADILLGADYPRLKPQLRWRTPLFHPNISEAGSVCLGGYSTGWVPSVGLDRLCEMLWDMLRYANYDVTSPYNRDAAQWARTQTAFAFPLDGRSLRDRLARPPGRPAAGGRGTGDDGILLFE